MAGFIPEHIIDEIRNAADIAEVVSSYVNLKRAGNLYTGLCPFHAEKTPSFKVNPERRIFHCFGCGVGGNVFRFLMLQKGISFPEAVAELAERYGIELPQADYGRSRAGKQTKAGLYQAVALAQKFFEDELSAASGKRARDYLARRGLNQDLIQEFHLGWAPPGWDNLGLFLDSKGVEAEVMEVAGLVKARGDGRSRYDTFRARVICPIFGLDGQTVAFGGRLLEEEERQPKYLNSPETPIYHKGRFLYGLDRNRAWLRERKTVLIVEGYFDLLSLAAQGVRHVVATLGTALTPGHLRLLQGHVDQAVLLFDADEAGRAAAARALPLFMSVDLEGRVLQLPEGHDPDTYVREYGPKALEDALAEAVMLLDFYLDRTMARYPGTLAGKSRVAREIVTVIAGIKDRTRQDLLRRAAAERLGVSEEALRLSERRREIGPQDRAGVVEGITADFETEVLRLVLLHPQTSEIIFGTDLGPHFVGSTTRRVYEAMARYLRRAGRLAPDLLLEDLKPEEADFVTGLVLSEDGLDGEDLTAAHDFIEKFISRSQRRRSADLSRRIKEAQQVADYDGLERLLQEKNRLIKEKTLGE